MTTPLASARRRPYYLDRHLGYVMLVPAVILLLVLILAPIVYSIVLSTYDWGLTDVNRAKPFVGLGNFAKFLVDPVVGTALVNTVVFVVASVTIELVLGFVVAMALFEINRGRRMANSLILLPMVIAPVIASLLWRYMLDPGFGTLSQVLRYAGIGGGIDWFGSDSRALAGLVIVDVWQWTPFVILILHSGMLSVPQELFEAARVDGASRPQIAQAVIIPALQPLILLVLLFRTMDTYRIFDTVFVLTKGGPGLSTETIGLYTYQTGFSYFDMGYAMALSTFILVTVVAISAFYVRLLRRRGVLR
jgi:multiple sugar transport system permease protein